MAESHQCPKCGAALPDAGPKVTCSYCGVTTTFQAPSAADTPAASAGGRPEPFQPRPVEAGNESASVAAFAVVPTLVVLGVVAVVAIVFFVWILPSMNRCGPCDGTGIQDCGMCEGGTADCIACAGPGSTCSFCGGKGSSVCTFCDGKGKYTCRFCKGSGKN